MASSSGSSRRPKSALDRPLPTRGGKNEVALSAFAFLFSEFIQYSQQRVNTADELERKLEEAGVGIGHRALELGCLREKSSAQISPKPMIPIPDKMAV